MNQEEKLTAAEARSARQEKHKIGEEKEKLKQEIVLGAIENEKLVADVRAPIKVNSLICDTFK